MARDVRVVVAGDQGMGKSTLTFNVKYGNLPSTVEPFCFTDSHSIDTASSEQKLDEQLKQSDVVVLTHACHDPSTLSHIHTFWLPKLRQLKVNVPLIVVGCELYSLDEQQKVQLKLSTSDVMKWNPEVEICIECSANENIWIHKVLSLSRIAAVYPSAPLFDENRILTPLCRNALKRIFRLSDMDKDGCLSEEDINWFEYQCFNIHLRRSEMDDLMKEVKDILPDGVNGRSLTLKGFYCYYELFRKKGRLDLAWKVLKQFGYNDDIKFDVDHFLPIMEKTLDMNVELTDEAIEFLKRTFDTYDTDHDGTLERSELEDIFSMAPESPWSKAPYLDAAELGGLSIDGFLSEWVLMTVRDPVHSVMNLKYIGYDGDPVSAIHVAQRCIDHERNQSDRYVFQCFVFGPKKAGKSALVNTLIKRPFYDYYIPTTEDRYAVNAVNLLGEKKTLIMREIPEVAANHLLSKKDALSACDIAIFVYDSSSEPSWKRTAKLLRKVESHGYKGPFLIVATKDDLDPHEKALQDSIRVSQNMGIDAPISFSSKEGDYKDVFQKIIRAAEDPRHSIPETDDGKSCKQSHQLANSPLPFQSEAFKKDHEDGKEYVWMILSDVGNSPLRVGGALCIDPSGILITTVIAACQSPELSLKNLEQKLTEDQNKIFQKSKIPTYVQARKGDRVCRAKLEKIFEDCGVLFYCIVKENNSEQFPFVNLETVGDVRLDKKGRLYGYIHEGGPSLDFSYVCGLNNYGIPPNDESFSSSRTMNSMSYDERQDLFDSTVHESAPYRTIGEVVDLVTCEDVTCIPVEASSMFCKLPLIQVSGLGLETYRGQSGCPVFTCKEDELIGLILYTKGCYSFILPVNVLRYCVKILYKDDIASTNKRGAIQKRKKRKQ